MNGLSPEVIEAVCDHFPAMPGQMVWTQHLGGAVGRKGSQDTAFTHRAARFNIGLMAVWSELSQARFDEYRQSIREYWSHLDPHTMGFYTNLMQGDDQKTNANFGVNPERLRAIKQRFDLDNLFRLNTNIQPRDEV